MAGSQANIKSLVGYAWIAVAAVCAGCVYGTLRLDYNSSQADGFHALGIWAFALTAAWLLSVCLPSAKRRYIKLLALLLFYLVSYCSLSASGGYYYSRSGNMRYTFGLSVPDISIWFPRGVYWEPFTDVYGKRTSKGTALGYYYSALVIFDRAWLHPTRNLFEDDSVESQEAK